ncbi:uncharacterized protein LOC100832028 [Brachypodium distachyon]|uniref:Uncharacterized protein n=1 Tax=Brachypodium distachyon TaxID=15368 RepID=I1HB77_BRADI|nr:uncharacterized protein LOC100832028 [Brachypodium distachyon]KQK02318.1 hypothetical protein BRADI_2g00780v3 [Brachypodium distachyon]|eukprot:XP_003565229.1 uncharacterized protein LOC100832028 [Brachypodium distachyon]
MAGVDGKEELGIILMQAKCASHNIRHNRDRMLQLQLRLQEAPAPGDDDEAARRERLEEVVSGIVDVYFTGIEAGARYLGSCLTMAAENGARLALNPVFALMPDDKLFDALLAQKLPARPTTQVEAFSRVESAFYAVKLPQEHLLPRCVEHLVNIARPATAASEPPKKVSAKTGRRRRRRHGRAPSAPATVATNEPPQDSGTTVEERPRDTSGDMEQARAYLDRACTAVNLAIKHVDLAVMVISSFLDPKDVARFSDLADGGAFLG